MSHDGVFEFESVEDEKSIQAFLTALSDGFGKGRVVLSSEGGRIELSPHAMLIFLVKYRSKEGENRLCFRFSWRDQDGQDKAAKGLNVES